MEKTLPNWASCFSQTTVTLQQVHNFASMQKTQRQLADYNAQPKPKTYQSAENKIKC